MISHWYCYPFGWKMHASPRLYGLVSDVSLVTTKSVTSWRLPNFVTAKLRGTGIMDFGGWPVCASEWMKRVAGRRIVCTQQIAALFCVKRHGHHLNSLTSNWKSNSISRCVFSWKQLIRISAESDLKWQSLRLFWRAFLSKKNKMCSAMGSVPDPIKQ